MPQLYAFYTFLAVAGLLVIIFIYVALSTRRPREIDIHKAYSLRAKFFIVLLAVLLVSFGVTVAKTPYPKRADIPDKVVFVVGKQFSFALSDSPITTDDQYEALTYAAPVKVPRGSLVEFRV